MADGIHRSAYRFFGRLVAVHSDSAEVVAALDKVYERQRVAADDLENSEPAAGNLAAWEDGALGELAGGPSGRGHDPLAPDIVVYVRSGGADGPRIVVGGRTVRVPAVDQLVHYAHLVLVNAAASHSRGTLVLHGGAVERDGRAVVLVGASGWGKSTLTLELVRRGWRLLSDDFAAVTADGVVQPFPRRVNLTDHTLALLGLASPEDGLRLAGFHGRPKWMIDGGTLFAGRLGQPTPLGAVFLLAPTPDEPGQEAAGDTVWRLQVDHLPPDLIPRLAALPGVREVKADGSATAPHVVTLIAAPGARIVAGLDAVCAACDVAVLSAHRGDGAAPRFAGPPDVAAIVAADAVPRLLSHALSLSGRRFVSGTRADDVLDALALARAALSASGAPVYRLVPGELSATADRVEALASTARGEADAKHPTTDNSRGLPRA